MGERGPVRPMLHHMDAREHGIVAKPLAAWFGREALDRFEPQIEQFAQEFVDRAYEMGQFDVVHDVAWPLASKTAALVCGVPLEDSPYVKQLTEEFQDREPGKIGLTEKGEAAIGKVIEYLLAMIKERRAAGFDGDGMIDMFGKLVIQGDAPGDDLAIAMNMVNFFVGGGSQFPKGFAAMVYRLFTEPDQRAEVIANPDLGLPAFQEALRIDNPTNSMGRFLSKPHEIHGQKLLPGQGVVFLYASAGRDGREFENPDVFDIHRLAPRTLSFGVGMHTCIAKGLGLRQGKALTRIFLEKMPQYTVDVSELEPIRTEYMRGWVHLPARAA